MEHREEENIKGLYADMYRGMITKDKRLLESVLDESFVLVHMTGMRQNREDYIEGILRGVLNYYSEEPVQTSVAVFGDTAKLIGQSIVNAAVFGGGRHTWRLQQDTDLVKKDGVWRMTK